MARRFLLLDLICFLDGFLDGSSSFRKPAEIGCHAFEAFSSSYILLELEMTVPLFELSLILSLKMYQI